jgi:hypothetical protein
MIILKREVISCADLLAHEVYTENPAHRDKRTNQGVQAGMLKILKGETKSFFKINAIRQRWRLL